MIIYSKCSVTCGSGSKQRTVECSRSEVSCDPTKKPTSTARCELGACPKWETREWSAVSVSQNTLNFQPQWSLVIVPHRGLTVVQPYRKVRLSGYFCLNDSCLNASDLYRVPSFQCSVTCGDGTKVPELKSRMNTVPTNISPDQSVRVTRKSLRWMGNRPLERGKPWVENLL